MSKIILGLLILISISGCASIFTARPPIIEDKVGGKVATLATAPDYRVVYVKLKNDAKLCAEGTAETGAQFAQSFATALSGEISKIPITADAQLGIALGLKQLFKRSQGIELYRNGVFALCNIYLNGDGKVTEEKYLIELRHLLSIAEKLILKELSQVEKPTIDPAQVPSAPPLINKIEKGK